MLPAANGVYFFDSQYSVSLMEEKSYSEWESFLSSLYFPSIHRKVYYKSSAESLFRYSIYPEKNKEQAIYPQFCILFHHSISRGISDTVFKRLSPINSYFRIWREWSIMYISTKGINPKRFYFREKKRTQ